MAIIEITAEFLRENPDVYLQTGTGRREIETGWHFGSRYPGDPARSVVYDFLPDTILEKVENLEEFRGALAFDKWMGNADSRQAIFFRARLRDWLPGSTSHPLRLGFVAQMVDNGFAFEGPHWRFGDSPIQGLYFRPLVYQSIRGPADFQPWLDRIVNFPEEIVDQAVRELPPSWVEGEDGELEGVLEKLMTRRRRVPDLLDASRTRRGDPFPMWVRSSPAVR